MWRKSFVILQDQREKIYGIEKELHSAVADVAESFKNGSNQVSDGAVKNLVFNKRNEYHITNLIFQVFCLFLKKK